MISFADDVVVEETDVSTQKPAGHAICLENHNVTSFFETNISAKFLIFFSKIWSAIDFIRFSLHIDNDLTWFALTLKMILDSIIRCNYSIVIMCWSCQSYVVIICCSCQSYRQSPSIIQSKLFANSNSQIKFQHSNIFY